MAYLTSCTLPARGATAFMQARQAIGAGFLSTLPARGATGETFTATAYARISTHAPREGSDRRRGYTKIFCVISIHAPREGSDGVDHVYRSGQDGFLSTLPARGATT